MVYQIPVYTINALLLQTPNGSGLSILDARGDLVYVSAYQNNKCLIKPQVMKVAEAELLIPQYKYLSVYIQYKSADIFNNLIYHISNFKKVTNIHKLHPLYIKQPL